MRQECRERFPRHQLQMKPLVSDPDMHHGACVTHVPWCMSRSLTGGGGTYASGISGACATRNTTYLATGPWILYPGSMKYTLPLTHTCRFNLQTLMQYESHSYLYRHIVSRISTNVWWPNSVTPFGFHLYLIWIMRMNKHELGFVKICLYFFTGMEMMAH